jgi:hypothetical protein
MGCSETAPVTGKPSLRAEVPAPDRQREVSRETPDQTPRDAPSATRSPTWDSRPPRRSSRVFVQRAPTCRQAARGGAPWRSHAFTARPRRSVLRVDVPQGSRVGARRASRCLKVLASSRAARRRARNFPRQRPPRAVAPATSRTDARRAHGSAGASRPTRRPGGLVGARRRAGLRSTRAGRADVDRRRGIAARPDVRRASSFSAPRRAAKPRTEARLGAPMRSPRVRVGARRAPSHPQPPAPTPAARMGAPGRRVRRDGPAASSGRGVARGFVRRGRAAPTSIADGDSRSPRRSSLVFVQRAPTCRQAARGGAPWRSHAFTARPRRSAPRAVAPATSRADARRAHGSAGASRPTRRPGRLAGARRRAGLRSTPRAAPTSIADVG